MKIMTLCGSLKFKKEMMETAEKMALKGNCILTPVYPVLENYERTDEQLKKLKEEHFKRIELADAILVVNVNNYIGDSTNLEIEYAKKLGKEILYYTDFKEQQQKYKLVFIAFIIFCILAVGIGFFFKSRYKTYDEEYLNNNLATDVALINAIDDFYQNSTNYNAEYILDNDVYKVTIIDKKIYGSTVVSSARINQVYAGDKKVDDIIEIKENVRLDMQGETVLKSCDYLDAGFVKDDDYIVVLKPSEYALDMYDLAYKEFSYLRLSDGYVDTYVDMYQTIMPYDENGNTYLYYMNPDIDIALIETFYGQNTMDNLVEEFNNAGKAMYDKLIELSMN